MKKLTLSTSAALVSELSIATVSHAQWIDALKKSKDSGNIYLGFRESSIPFSYYAEKATGHRLFV